MSTELQIAILGIVGTLSGTVLGWLLNSLSQKGKLNVFVKKWEESYQKQDDMGGFENCNCGEAEYYNYNLSLDIYNSSRENRIMRDIQLVFGDKKKHFFATIPIDASERRSSHQLVHCDEISVVNIPAKSVLALDLHGGWNSSNDKWRQLLNSNRIMFIYTDDKSKRIIIKICKKE